jgi:hemolysin activation/secretion protein
MLSYLLLAGPAPGLAQQDITFDIQGYAVDGAALLPPEQVKAVLAPYTGKARSFGDVQRALKALESAYAKAGYAAVQVYLPEQELADGVVRFRVVEGKIRRVLLPQTRYFDHANLRRSLPALQEGRTPNPARIADNLRLANDSPAKQTNVLLRGGGEPGELDATVEVTEQRPYRAFLTADNGGSPSTGSYRTGVGLQHSNLWNRDHVVTGQYITNPAQPSQVTIFSAGYRAPLYALGDSIDLIAGYSDVNAATTITPAGPLAFSGSGKLAAGRYNFNLRRIAEYEHRLIFGLDWREYQNVCSLGNLPPELCPTPPSTVTVHPLSLTYDGRWARPGSQLAFYGGVSRNVPGGNNGEDADFKLARFGAGANYTLYRAGFNVARALPRDFQVRLGLVGQYSNDALIPGEQFGLGGANSVRGFLEREIAADYGYSGQAEVYTPDLAPPLKLERVNFRFLAFYDFGHGQRRDTTGFGGATVNIGSAGAGFRFTLSKYLSLRGDIARVLDAGGIQGKGDVRGHIALFATF